MPRTQLRNKLRHTINVRLSEEVFQALTLLADRRECPMGVVVRDILRDYVAGSVNPAAVLEASV